MHHTIWGWNDKDLDDDLFVDVDPINYEAWLPKASLTRSVVSEGDFQKTDVQTKRLGVFLVTTTLAFIPVNRVDSVNTYSDISTGSQDSEWSECARPWMEQASERAS